MADQNTTTPVQKNTSSSEAFASISPNGTEIRESKASVTVDDGTGEPKTISISNGNTANEADTITDLTSSAPKEDSPDGTETRESKATASIDDGTGEPKTISVSNGNTANEADTITDLTSSAPKEDISEVRQTESSQFQPLVTDSFVNNGSFEGSSFEPGTFENWRTIGDTSIETKEIGINPTDGEFQALISNGFSDAGGSVEESDLSNFLDLTSGSLDILVDGNATEGSGIKQAFTAKAGDILEFDYSLLTNEATPSESFNDSAFFSVGNFALKLGDTSDPTFSDKSVEGYSQATDSKTIKVAISEAGTYNLGFGIVDLTDSIVDSGILIDDVKLISTGAGSFSSQGTDSDRTDVDFTFGSNGFEPVNGSNTQQ